MEVEKDLVLLIYLLELLEVQYSVLIKSVLIHVWANVQMLNLMCKRRIREERKCYIES